MAPQVLRLQDPIVVVSGNDQPCIITRHNSIVSVSMNGHYFAFPSFSMTHAILQANADSILSVFTVPNHLPKKRAYLPNDAVGNSLDSFLIMGGYWSNTTGRILPQYDLVRVAGIFKGRAIAHTGEELRLFVHSSSLHIPDGAKRLG